MEFSLYLQAIQKVAGQTLGEKNKTLHHIAKKIIDNCKNPDEFIEVYPSEELPEPLIPLVKLEIARLLRKPEGIVDALKSDDQTVFDRALRVKWFFNGSVENCLNVQLFRNHILPYISLNRRLKFIKILAINLTANQLSTTAEEFYDVLSKMYGHTQARPLLKACSESFIQNKIQTHKIVLYIKELDYLYHKYPDIVVDYLKLQKKVESGAFYYQDHHIRLFNNYEKVFPKILRKNSKNFVELIQTHGTILISLNNQDTNLFLKNEIDAFMDDPKKFMPMLPQKEVIKILTKSQFIQVAKKYYPEELKGFTFDNVYSSIFKHVPEAEKMSLMMSCFEEIYGKSLLDYPDKLSPLAMKFLPRDERIRQARIKLETDSNWYLDSFGWRLSHSWRCYLPIEESIPLIKDGILKSDNINDRVAFIKQLIFTCSINDDKDALLEVLKYILTRHRNEKKNALFEIFDRLTMDFQIQYLPLEHWEVIYDFLLNFFGVASADSIPELDFDHEEDCWNIICCRIHFDLDHDAPIADKINVLTRINASIPCRNKWNILEELPRYEKICLNEFMQIIPTVFFEEKQKNSFVWKDTVTELVKAMYDFNQRNSKKPSQTLEKFTVKNYPWLLEEVKKLVSDETKPDDNFDVSTLIFSIKSNEPDLLNDLQIAKKNKKTLINLTKALSTLHRNPGKILTNWEKYYRKCKRDIDKKVTRRFLRICRWCQSIPAKFMERVFEDVLNNREKAAVIVAANLLDGLSFPMFITPHLPEIKVNDAAKVIANKHDPILSSIATCLNIVNPPASLDFILKFCEADYVHLILGCLLNQGRRVAVNKLLPFCEELISRRVSVRKHGVRILRISASAKELHRIITTLWREESHRSIQPILMDIMLGIFKTNPCSETWQMINECFDDLSADKKVILDAVSKIDNIPKEYAADYIRKLFKVFGKIRESNSSKVQSSWYYTQKLLSDLRSDFVVSFPEEFHEEIFQMFLINLSVPQNILSTARTYLIKWYLEPAGDKLDERLKVFSKVFVEIAKNHWDEPCPNDPTFCPANYFVHRLNDDIVMNLPESLLKRKIIKTALKCFLSVLKPQQEPQFYCYFTIAELYNSETTLKEFVDKISKFLPSLIETFSVEFMFFIAKFLYELVDKFYGENAQLDVIERFLALNNDHANSLAAALLLNQNQKSNDERFWRIFRALRKNRHPIGISSTSLAALSFHNYTF